MQMSELATATILAHIRISVVRFALGHSEARRHVCLLDQIAITVGKSALASKLASFCEPVFADLRFLFLFVGWLVGRNALTHTSVFTLFFFRSCGSLWEGKWLRVFRRYWKTRLGLCIEIIWTSVICFSERGHSFTVGRTRSLTSRREEFLI